MARPATGTPAPRAAGTLPLKEYFTSLASVSMLVMSCVVLFPRSTDYFFYVAGIPHASPVRQRSSADRPEHPFLTPITAVPAASAVWCVLGDAVTMAWWGSKMAVWWGPGPQRTPAQRTREAALATLSVALVLLNCITLLGAPLSHVLESLLLAIHLALLTAWPIVYTLGIPSMYEDGIAARYRLTRLVCSWRAETQAERALAYPMAGALIGAWLGAFPLALDWDRPWQSWPLTPLAGSAIGFIVGGYVSWARSAMASLRSDIAEENAVNAANAAAEQQKAATRKRKGNKAK